MLKIQKIQLILKTVQKKTEINKCGVKIYESSVTDKQRRS